MQHQQNCQCYACTNGIEKYQATKAESIKNSGWATIAITDDPTTPFNVNIYTEGLPQNFQHLNLQICSPMPRNDYRVAHEIIATAIALIKGGQVLLPGNFYDDIIVGYKVATALALDDQTAEPLLRLIIPDKNGQFNTCPLCHQWEGTAEAILYPCPNSLHKT